MVRLTNLGENLSILHKNNVMGLDGKIRSLIASRELYEKTVYELQVAAAYAKANHQVAFLEEKPVEQIQTPDMIIDEQVEVECKKKDRLSERDRRNEETVR